MNSRVFIIGDCLKHDISAAAEYGEFVNLLSIRQFGVWSKEYSANLALELKAAKFDPKKDFLLSVGYTAALMISAGVIWSNYGPFKALMYYPPSSKYVSFTVGDSVRHDHASPNAV